MPELPDITLYLECLAPRVLGETLQQVRLRSPFLLRTADPPLDAACGKRVVGLRRLGKRIVFELDGHVFAVLHLMIAGRLRWHEQGCAIKGKTSLAAFDFSSGTLLLTEASPKKRASLHLVRGEPALRAMNPGGLEVLDSGLEDSCEAVTRTNHTLKRALTDPRILSGIGNAYSDEILHAARLSPIKQTRTLTQEELAELHRAVQEVMRQWIGRLREDLPTSGFPEKVTAFRPGMAVHGRYGRPCPRCGGKVQRIVYAANETNYCPPCQTGGRLLADRSLSRLLKKDWPRTLAELEEQMASKRA
ncbi:MAG: formamidopyrimidine-DNA glycosylase [Proteobacteria bacterium]|nr:formamidopyrimidine-DNA glycosylase [Pseudomonadota bacterium]